MTQSQALEILKTGANVFLTGEPGAGKTYVLNQYTAWLYAAKISAAVTASTGIAATHIGGITIHSWSGIGTRDTLTTRDIDAIAGKEKLAKRMQKASVLVIDEISMLDGRVLDMVNKVCQVVRGREEPFGGLQIIVVGDFFQLPPIAGRGDMARFAFESHAWDSARFVTCYLTEQHRQEDELLLGLLGAIRTNSIEEDHYTLLGEQTEIAYSDIEPTKLFTHNAHVDTENIRKIASLHTPEKKFSMQTRGTKHLVEGLIRTCLSPQELVLKEGAMVMCTKNNFEVGYVNGTLGRVIGYDAEDGYPRIETSDKREIKITPTEWTIQEDGKVLAQITQVPLRLAWAITVHKSQGMSLDAAEIDLRNAFTYGQGYVALSRVRTLGGMKVIGINSHALVVDPRVVLRDLQFKEESEDAEHAFDEMDEEEITKMQKNFVATSGGVWVTGAPQRGAPTYADAVKKESTYAISKQMIAEGKSVTQIAKDRDLTASTIWNHVEKLLADGELTKKDLASLTPNDQAWKSAYTEMCAAFEKHGTEKLKPVYEATEERYDYEQIRIGRILYMYG